MSGDLRRIDSVFGHDRARFMPVSGELMSPSIMAGDMVAVVPETGYRGAGIYALNVHDDIVCLYRVEDLADGTLALRPDNPAYARHEMSRADIDEMIIGRVFGVLRVLDRGVVAALSGGDGV